MACAIALGHGRASIPGPVHDVADHPALVLAHRSRARAGPVLPVSGEHPRQRARPAVLSRVDRAAFRVARAGGFMARRLHRLSCALSAVSCGGGVVEVLGGFSTTPHPDPPPGGGGREAGGRGSNDMASQIVVDPSGGRAFHVAAGRALPLPHRPPPPPPPFVPPPPALPLLLCH